jgi:hypothetical protein
MYHVQMRRNVKHGEMIRKSVQYLSDTFIYQILVLVIMSAALSEGVLS